MSRRPIILLLLSFACLGAGGALAQDKGSVNPKPLPSLANPNDPDLAAKELFARKLLPSKGPAHVIGSYTRGCIGGAEQIPINGDHWQVMRLSRNRSYGHPDMIALIKRLAARAHKNAGWPGILVGDIAQPRGGPALSGHASHQIGLDADIWLTPMPDRRLSAEEREKISAVSMVDLPHRRIDRRVWTPERTRIIRRASLDPRVARIFVNPAIKKQLCEEAGRDRAWLNKVRPWWGHDYHFHVRLQCPRGWASCVPQAAPPPGDGCGAELDSWLQPPKPPKPGQKPPPTKKPRPMMLADLPEACRTVLLTGETDIAAVGATIEAGAVPRPRARPQPE